MQERVVNIKETLQQSFWIFNQILKFSLNFQVIFTVTVGQNKSGEVGFDDVTFVNGECSYIGM